MARSVPLWLLSVSLAVAGLAVGLAAAGAAVVGLLTLAIWFWFRRPHLLAVALGSLGAAAAAFVLCPLAFYARDAVRELRYRIDPAAARNARYRESWYVPSWRTRPGWPSHHRSGPR